MLGGFEDASGCKELEAMDNFEEGCLVVAAETEDGRVTLADAVRSYADACKQLAGTLTAGARSQLASCQPDLGLRLRRSFARK